MLNTLSIHSYELFGTQVTGIITASKQTYSVPPLELEILCLACLTEQLPNFVLNLSKAFYFELWTKAERYGSLSVQRTATGSVSATLDLNSSLRPALTEGINSTENSGVDLLTA
jgi:hypothetical protein